MLEMVREISNMVDIHFIRQKEPKGLGHAIHCAKSFVGNQPFAVLLVDDIVDNEVPCLAQLIRAYNEYNTSILGRYIITLAIFEILENQKPEKGGEMQLTYALKTLGEHEAIYAYKFEGRRYDVGDKLGFLEVTVDFALKRDKLGKSFM